MSVDIVKQDLLKSVGLEKLPEFLELLEREVKRESQLKSEEYLTKYKEYKAKKQEKIIKENNSKINIVYFSGGRRNCTRRLQNDFIIKLKDLCNLKVYGPHEQEIVGKELCPIEYNPNFTANDLVSEFNADIFLFFNEITLKRCQPKDLYKSKVPVVMFAIDYYSFVDSGQTNWLFENDIDLLINRGPYKDCVIPSVWVPFSANEDEFYTDPDSDYYSKRKKDIGFIGSFGGKNPYYRVRKNAIQTLQDSGLLNKADAKQVDAKDYPKELKKYKMLLSCSFPPLFHTPAKDFEIMASGTALLSTWFEYKETLFGDKKVYFEYNYNMTDICDVVNYIKNNPYEAKEVTKNALEVINEKHLDKHRIVELYTIMEDLVKGRPITKKWGV